MTPRTKRGGAASRGRTGDRASQAYERLRELIVHGSLAPGTRIVEAEVAERLGVSRTPVRSALQRLQQEGYIVTTTDGRKARASVAPLTQEDARELFGIVGEVEGLAARWAAQLPDEPREALVRRLEEINDSLLAAARGDRPDQNVIFERDTEFHHEYVTAGSGARLRALHDSVKPQAERYIRLYIQFLVDEIHTSVDEHAAVVDGIRDQSPDAAQNAVQTNWRNAAKRLAKVIGALGERGSW